MNSRQWFRVSGSFASAILFAGASLLLVPTLPVQAQSAFTAPTTAILATSATQTVTVSITTAGTLATINVLTQGATGQDYAAVAGGTCATSTPYTVGQTCTVKFSFTPTHPWVRYGGISLSDASGKLLGNSFLNGVGTGPQVSYPLSAATVPSVLGSGLSSPLGVALDGSGNVYVADTGHGAVKELKAVAGVVPASPTIVTWSGFSSPSGVAVDGSGDVYVADTGNNAVKELIAVGGVVPATPTIVPLGSGYSSPTGVAVDGSGNVYVADMNHNAVEELVAVGGVIPSGATPTPLGSGFSTPEGVAVDGSGDVFVADTHNSLVKEIVAVGGVIPASPTITPLGSGFFSAAGVAIDGSGNVYVADTGNSAVKEIVAVGGAIPASPTILTLGTGFSAPGGVAVDASGDVYVADKGNSAAKEMNAQNSPTLAFASTAVGATSSDSPKNLTVANNGNAPLLFTVPTTGSNPSISTNFSLSPSSTCPQLTSTASGPGSLAAGSSCMDIVSFSPTLALPLTGSLSNVDNNLNATSSTQTISLTGNTPTITVSPSSAVVDASSVTLTASVAYGAGTPTGAVTFAVNGGSSVAATCTGSSSPRICTASYTPSSLTVTSAGYSIVATEAADGTYTAASGTGTLIITQGTPVLTLSTSGSPSTVNSSVTFTIAVTPNSGITPSGSVSFSSTLGGVTTPISGCTSVAPVAGLATCPTNALPAGSYSITASIAADTNFVSANSNTIPQTVSPAPTTLAIPTPSGSSTVDAPVALIATLSSSAGFTPNNAAGTVSFTANGSPITGCTGLILGATTHQATCTAYSLVVPADVIAASYSSSNSNFLASSAPTITQTVTTNTPISNGVSSSQPTAVVNQTVTFTATISPNGATSSGVVPTGSVTFHQGSATGPIVCGPAVVAPSVLANGTGTATCSNAFTSPLSAVSIFAVYSGDSNFAGGNQPSVSQTVTAAPTAATVTSNLSSVGVNQSVLLTVTVTPANPVSVTYTGTVLPKSGSVSLSDSVASGVSVCPSATQSISSAGVLTYTCPAYTLTSLGNHIITATYTSSDPNFTGTAASGSTTIPITVVVTTSGVGLTLSPATGPAGLTVDQSGSFTAGFTNFPAGLTASPGTVTYMDGATAISGANCTNVAVPASGTLPSACSYSFPTAGLHSISVAFTPGSGGSAFQPLTSNSVSVSVGLTPLTLKATPPSPLVDTPTTFTATVSLPSTATGSTVPNGQITFTPDVGVPCTTPAVTTTGSTIGASCALTFGTAIAHTVTVSYSNDSNFTATNIPDNVTVAKTVLTLAATPPSPSVDTPTTFTATVTLPSTATGSTVPNGQITFTPDVGTACTQTVTTTGSTIGASCALTFGTAIAHTVTVSYSNDSNFTATSIPDNVTVAQATPTITIASSSSIGVATQTVIFTAIVTFPSTSPAPTKLPLVFTLPSPYGCSSVTQTTSGSTYTYTCPVTFPLNASFSQQPVSATYSSGDPNYGAATATLTQTVQNFTLSAATPAALTISQGNTNLSDTYTSQAISLTVSPLNNFSDPLVLTCAITPLTTGLTCTPNATTGATFTATITAPSSAAPGSYTVTYTVSDSNPNVPGLLHTATASLSIVNQAPTAYVSSSGTIIAPFTAPSGLATTGLSCNSKLATQITGTTNYTTSTNETLSSQGIQCTNFSTTSNGYTFTIVAGTQSARLDIGRGQTVLAVLGAPFLLMLGLLPASRKFRKALLHGLAILAVGMLLMHATGCGSGGFPEPQSITHATDGSYLLDIVNGQTTVAEVPLVVSN